MYQVISYLVDYYYNDLLLCFLNSSGGSTNSEGVLPVASLASDLDRRVSRIQGGQVTLILSCSHSASILSSDWLTASYSVPILSSDWFRTSDASDVSHCDPKFVWPQLHRQHAHVSPGTRRWHVPIMSVAAHEMLMAVKFFSLVSINFRPEHNQNGIYLPTNWLCVKGLEDRDGVQ